MINLLITGGAGYIGRQIINLLNKNKYNIVVIDNLSTTKKSYLKKKYIIERISILNQKKLDEVFKKYNFESVIHLAAKCVVSESQRFPKIYFKTNIKGTKNIIKYCKKYKIKNFIFSSSCSVYGNSSGVVKERTKKNL